METKVSIDAARIRRYPAEQALDFASEILGPSEAWSTSLVGYRISSECQADWKLEVGCWLLLARELGFLQQLRARLGRAVTRLGSQPVGGPNDKAHLVLNQELTQAMIAYYLIGVGWEYDAWEPKVDNGDVDIRLRSPDGRTVDVQVKAPDQPGTVVGHSRVDGEQDERVLSAIDHALTQLNNTPGPCRLVAVSPQRTWSMGGSALTRHLLGTPSVNGVFAKARAVSAVTDIHLLRGAEECLYRCTVVLNPWCDVGATLPATAFPHARVHQTVEGRSAWMPEPPGR